MSARKWKDDEIALRKPVCFIILMANKEQKRQNETISKEHIVF